MAQVCGQPIAVYVVAGTVLLPFVYVICVVAGRWPGYLGMYVGRLVAWLVGFVCCRHVSWPVEFLMLAGMWPG